VGVYWDSGRNTVCDDGNNLDESSLSIELIVVRMIMMIMLEVICAFQKDIDYLILKEVFQEVILKRLITDSNYNRDKLASK
jgi:hypothetical protein